MRPESRHAIAAHEAGHAVVAIALGWGIRFIRLTGRRYRRSWSGVVRPILPLDDERIRRAALVRQSAVIDAAGPTASLLISEDGGYAHDDPRDGQGVWRYAQGESPNAAEDTANAVYNRAIAILCMPKYARAWHALTEALLRHQRIAGDEAAALIRRAMERPRKRAA